MLLNSGNSDLGVMGLHLASAFIQKRKLDPQYWETPSYKFLSRRKQDLAFVGEEVGRSDLGGPDPESNPWVLVLHPTRSPHFCPVQM